MCLLHAHTSTRTHTHTYMRTNARDYCSTYSFANAFNHNLRIHGIYDIASWIIHKFELTDIYEFESHKQLTYKADMII